MLPTGQALSALLSSQGRTRCQEAPFHPEVRATGIPQVAQPYAPGASGFKPPGLLLCQISRARGRLACSHTLEDPNR